MRVGVTRSKKDVVPMTEHNRARTIGLSGRIGVSKRRSRTVSGKLLALVLVVIFVPNITVGDPQGVEGQNSNEQEGLEFLRTTEAESSRICNHVMEASWAYHTNLTEINRRHMVLAQLQGAEFRRQKWRRAAQFRWKTFADGLLRRLFSFETVLGSAALSPNDRAEYAQLLQEMKFTFEDTKICPFVPDGDEDRPFRTRPRTSFRGGEIDQGHFGLDSEDYELLDNSFDDSDYDDNSESRFCRPTLKLDPDLIRIMAESRNPAELEYVWRAWRVAIGRPIRRKFLRFVRLSNKAARLNGFNNTGEFWQNDYESDSFEDDLERVWEDLRPLYLQLHAYVRKRLRDRYGEELFGTSGTIPAHILGNMWGQSWLNLLDITVPYPQRPNVDVTPAMRKQGYTPHRIFRTAQEFFTSIGFDSLPITFWLGSMFEKPIDREVICHASAWDFCNGVDFRVKQCTKITMKDLITAHHELGHVYYAIAYRNLPLAFRDGANPGLHEAIGDTIGLSVFMPSHLAKIGLLSSDTTTLEDDINFLFATALEKVAFLPFGLLVDKWRWSLFRRETSAREMNNYWWRLRITYQGISPPGLRDPRDFDPGAKYHIPANIPYVRYFIAYILQFQIFEELCRVSGHKGDLHECDFYQSKEAGRQLEKLLKLGKSYPWHIAISQFTNGRASGLDARPMLRYFRSLHEWLIRQNRDEQIGWSNSQALFDLSGALVNTSSATFIGVLVGVCATFILLGCLAVFCYRKFNAGEKTLNEVPTR